MRPAAKYSVGRLDEDRVDPVGARKESGGVWGDGNFEGNRRVRANRGFERGGKTSANSQKTCLRSSMTKAGQPETWISNVMSRKCRGGRSQGQKNLVRWSPLRRCKSLT